MTTTYFLGIVFRWFRNSAHNFFFKRSLIVQIGQILLLAPALGSFNVRFFNFGGTKYFAILDKTYFHNDLKG